MQYNQYLSNLQNLSGSSRVSVCVNCHGKQMSTDQSSPLMIQHYFFPWHLSPITHAHHGCSSGNKSYFDSCSCHSCPPLAHVLFSPVFTSFPPPTSSLIHMRHIKRPLLGCVLTGSPVTSSQAILRGAEPPCMRPWKRQCQSESTLESGQPSSGVSPVQRIHWKHTIGLLVWNM